MPIRGEEGGEEALEAWQTIVEENFAHTEEAIQVRCGLMMCCVVCW